MHSSVINFFSTKSIKEKIMKNTLSEMQVFLYFYLISMFDVITFMSQCLEVAGKELTLVDYVNIWGLLILNAFGFIILFLANGGARGKKFISKFFSLSFTVGYKYAIAFALCSVILTSTVQQIVTFVVLNLLMVGNIGFRMYQMR